MFPQVFESLQMGIAIIDPEGKILYTNPAEATMHGYRREELVGKHISILYPPTLWQPNILKYVQERHGWKQENINIRKDGTIFPVRELFDLAGEVDGVPVAIIISCEDITERKRLEELRFLKKVAEARIKATNETVEELAQEITERKRAEAQLRANAEYLRLALDTAQLGTWDYHSATGLLNCSERCRDMLGITETEPITLDELVAAIHPADREHVLFSIQRAMQPQDNGAFEAEFRTLGLLQAERWLVASGQVFFDDYRQPVRFIGTVADITERKQAEEERSRLLAFEQEARKQAEMASRLKDEFLGMVSHELRTPLTAMLGWIELMRDGVGDKEEHDNMLEALSRSARLQARIVEDLLDSSRIISGKLHLNLYKINLMPIIHTAVDSLRLAAEAKNIKINAMIDSQIIKIIGDPDRLQQIISNLLSNAVKFTPRNGAVDVQVINDEAEVRIVVTDTGQGISPDFLPHVFDRFRQADSSISRQHGGLGLGLAIARHLVDLHGGDIQVRSEGKGKGAIFTVTLPLAASNWGQYSERNNEGRNEDLLGRDQRPLDGVKVLVVEDEQDVCELFCQVLVRNGAMVKACNCADDALTLIGQWLPNVMLADIGIPGMDGYELITRVREQRPNPQGYTPAMALTAYASPEDRARALAAGFQLHMAKPVELSKLVTLVARLAHQHTPHQKLVRM